MGYVLSQKSITVYQTSITGDRLTKKANINWSQNFGASNTILFDTKSKYQKIFGFGGAFTEAAG